MDPQPHCLDLQRHPEGNECSVLRLLTDQLVSLELVDAISQVAIGNALKR